MCLCDRTSTVSTDVGNNYLVVGGYNPDGADDNRYSKSILTTDFIHNFPIQNHHVPTVPNVKNF